MLTDKDFAEYIKHERPLVIEFFSMWNADSRAFEETFKDIAAEFSSRANFMQSNINSNPDLSQKYLVTRVPCVLVFYKGELKAKISSFPSKRAFKEQFDNVLSSLSQF